MQKWGRYEIGIEVISVWIKEFIWSQLCESVNVNLDE